MSCKFAFYLILVLVRQGYHLAQTSSNAINYI
jgi:hypothetical protein